jgi:lipoprotein-releasing system ATP-binding protein
LLDLPTAGSVQVAGRETTVLDEEERARLRLESLGFVFQFHFLLAEFSA